MHDSGRPSLWVAVHPKDNYRHIVELLSTRAKPIYGFDQRHPNVSYRLVSNVK
jgi:hypothetical protein